MDPYLNIAKIESFSKYCFAICDIRFLDIAFKDVIKDVTDSESKYFDFSKTLHRSLPTPISIKCLYPRLEYGSDIEQGLLQELKVTLDTPM